MDVHTHQWMVISVFDPDGGGEDFAYTVGLAAKGSPELHLWRRPTDGDDPGADFLLSPSDAQHLLNRCAQQVLDGDLGPGSEFTVDYDCGLTLGRFTVGDPVDPDSVDAFQVESGATVLPLRWSIERPVPAPPQEAPAKVWHDITALGARVLAEPVAVVDSLTTTAALVRAEICGELGAQHALARRDGYSEALTRCEVLAAEHAARLTPAAWQVFDCRDDEDRAEIDTSVMELMSTVLRTAYSWFVVGDLPGDGALFSSKRLVQAAVAPRAERLRFWSDPFASVIRARSRRLSDAELLRLAAEVERVGDEHYEHHWWAAARSVGLGRGWPAGCPTDLFALAPSAVGLDGNAMVSVGQAISGAALAATLPWEATEAIEVLADPWRKVVGRVARDPG